MNMKHRAGWAIAGLLAPLVALHAMAMSLTIVKVPLK